jgi:hypothetical protein
MLRSLLIPVKVVKCHKYYIVRNKCAVISSWQRAHLSIHAQMISMSGFGSMTTKIAKRKREREREGERHMREEERETYEIHLQMLRAPLISRFEYASQVLHVSAKR